MQFAGVVNTAAVVPAHAGGKAIDLTPYIEGIQTVLATQDQSLQVKLEAGDVYTTVRRHFLVAGAAMGLESKGVCLRFRKVMKDKTPVAILISHGPLGTETGE